MAHPPAFYAKVAAGSFLLGMGMEYFMISTGFYEKVTAIESERLSEDWDDREKRHQEFWSEVSRQAKEKQINVPPEIEKNSKEGT
ncbi:hypothetical protein BSKO_12209 [Bryopsis sp. KO-2023]|nr:hypothetical protein BSKO_12209 [Bryopsis sp. KO-2023]